MKHGAQRPRPRLAAFIPLLALAFATPALADPPSHPVPRSKGEALKRYQEGRASYDKGDYESARLRFLQARLLDPDSPVLVWNLALAETKTHHGVEALRDFRRYFRLPASTDEDRATARAYMQTAEQDSGHVTVSASPGTTLILDGEPVTDPLSEPLDVEPGSHRLEARWQSQSKTLQVAPAAGETVSVDLRLEPVAAPSQPPPPPATAASAPILPDIVGALPQATTGPSNTTRIAVTTAFGAGAVAGVVLGIVFHANAGAAGDRAASLGSRTSCDGVTSATCAERLDAANSRASDNNAAAGLWIGAGVLAGAAVASWWLLAPHATSQSSARIVPLVSPSAAGGVVSGRF